jgi:hypothetical protein
LLKEIWLVTVFCAHQPLLYILIALPVPFKMSWHCLPPEIQSLIFKEISYLDLTGAFEEYRDEPYAWDHIRNYLLVSRMFSFRSVQKLGIEFLYTFYRLWSHN